jgi:hypothetical protein
MKITLSMAPVKQVPPLSPRMVAVLLLLGLSVFINYIDRGNLSIAAHLIQDELSISPTQLGLLLSAFFWTYACLQPIAGWLVDRIDVNWVLAGGFFLWSAARNSFVQQDTSASQPNIISTLKKTRSVPWLLQEIHKLHVGVIYLDEREVSRT